MTETAAGDSGPVFRLIYRSRSRVGAAERKHQLGEIFSVARSSNKKLGVTGALLITDDEFVQTLEGPEPVVRELYAKISKDRRHEHLELLESGDVSGRVFGRWAMAKVAAAGEPDIPLPGHDLGPGSSAGAWAVHAQSGTPHAASVRVR